MAIDPTLWAACPFVPGLFGRIWEEGARILVSKSNQCKEKKLVKPLFLRTLLLGAVQLRDRLQGYVDEKKKSRRKTTQPLPICGAHPG